MLSPALRAAVEIEMREKQSEWDAQQQEAVGGITGEIGALSLGEEPRGLPPPSEADEERIARRMGEGYGPRYVESPPEGPADSKQAQKDRTRGAAEKQGEEPKELVKDPTVLWEVPAQFRDQYLTVEAFRRESRREYRKAMIAQRRAMESEAASGDAAGNKSPSVCLSTTLPELMYHTDRLPSRSPTRRIPALDEEGYRRHIFRTTGRRSGKPSADLAIGHPCEWIAKAAPEDLFNLRSSTYSIPMPYTQNPGCERNLPVVQAWKSMAAGSVKDTVEVGSVEEVTEAASVEDAAEVAGVEEGGDQTRFSSSGRTMDLRLEDLVSAGQRHPHTQPFDEHPGDLVW